MHQSKIKDVATSPDGIANIQHGIFVVANQVIKIIPRFLCANNDANEIYCRQNIIKSVVPSFVTSKERRMIFPDAEITVKNLTRNALPNNTVKPRVACCFGDKKNRQ